MGKFVIGDLVTLSSAGCNSGLNSLVCGLIGIIVDKRAMIDESGVEDACPIKVTWFGLNTMGSGGRGMLPMSEWEIKFAKHGVVVKD